MCSATNISPAYDAALVLADGAVFYGFGIGKSGETVGELCFTTGMTGYQEVLTDPSFAGQIITFTFPHIGNTGCNGFDIESAQPAARGLVLREPITAPSNFRSETAFPEWLAQKGLTGICGVDTRRLTRHLRQNGAQNAVIGYVPNGTPDVKALEQKAKAHPSLKGMELAKENACSTAYEWTEAAWQPHTGYAEAEEKKHRVAVIDFGVKRNILRNLAARGCAVKVYPADTKAETILADSPSGVFLANGPGDPAATGEYALPEIKKLLEAKLPLFGICLGHQLLGLALGGRTEKMHQGHRGCNHPVQDVNSRQVYITSQNHGFVVSEDGLPDNVEVTHRSLFDGTIQGIALKGRPVRALQGHPEASPGPQDMTGFFDDFVQAMKESRVESRESSV